MEGWCKSMSIEELIEEERKGVRLIEEAKAKAERMLAEARRKAEEIMAQATKRELIESRIRGEEKKALEEAEKIKQKYLQEASRLQSTSENSIQKAVETVLKEVLKV